MRRFLSFVRQSRGRKKLVVEASIALCRAWYLVRLRPFATYARAFGTALPGLAGPMAPPAETTILRDIQWAISAVNRSSRGQFTCLMMAMAGKTMLDRRGVANTLVLGARRDAIAPADRPENEAAHAWLYAGNLILLGGAESFRFVPIVSYQRAPASAAHERG